MPVLPAQAPENSGADDALIVPTTVAAGDGIGSVPRYDKPTAVRQRGVADGDRPSGSDLLGVGELDSVNVDEGDIVDVAVLEKVPVFVPDDVKVPVAVVDDVAVFDAVVVDVAVEVRVGECVATDDLVALAVAVNVGGVARYSYTTSV